MNIIGFSIDWWTLWGIAAQIIFFLSFVVQWLISEKKKKSVLPIEFWIIRIIGSIMLIVYVFVRRDLVFLISLILQIVIYTRNIILIKNEQQ